MFKKQSNVPVCNSTYASRSSRYVKFKLINEENQTVSFLDLLITRNQDQININIYQKQPPPPTPPPPPPPTPPRPPPVLGGGGGGGGGRWGACWLPGPVASSIGKPSFLLCSTLFCCPLELHPPLFRRLYPTSTFLLITTSAFNSQWLFFFVTQI
jgi:hypothetical protein